MHSLELTPFEIVVHYDQACECMGPAFKSDINFVGLKVMVWKLVSHDDLLKFWDSASSLSVGIYCHKSSSVTLDYQPQYKNNQKCHSGKLSTIYNLV